MMQRIWQLINTEAGTLVVDVQSYLSPEVIVRSFIFKKGEDEYVMQVEVVGTNEKLSPV